MATLAIQRYPDEYDDMVVRPPCEQDETVLRFRQYYKYDLPWITVRAEGHGGTRFPDAVSAIQNLMIDQRTTTLLRADRTSVGVVIDDIKRAPFAYFRFLSIVSFLLFTLSLGFYSLLGVMLFNPVLALFGAFGSLLTSILVEASLLNQRKSLGIRPSGIRS